MLKERRLVPLKPVREGMHRFSFLLEVCVPGSVPDPQLLAAILDLVSIFFGLSILKKKKLCETRSRNLSIQKHNRHIIVD